MQQRIVVSGSIALLVAAFLLGGCGRSEQANTPAQAPSALPQPEFLSPGPSAPASSAAGYPAPAGVDAASASGMYPAPDGMGTLLSDTDATPTLISRRAQLQARIDQIHGEMTAHALQYQSDNATAIARNDPPLPTETPIWQPSPIPSYITPLPGGGFLKPISGTYFFDIHITNSWIYNLPKDEQIEVKAGAIIREWGVGGRKSLPEPYQGVLVLLDWMLVPDPEILGGPQRAGEVQIPLPAKDGAARVLDARAQGERLLLTIGTTGGSVYVFDVWQQHFSAPQPPTLALAAPETRPDGSVWLNATGEDQAGAMLSYRWDLDGDGAFETEGNPVQLPPASLAAGRTVAAQVHAKSGLSATAQITLP